jgi:predicted DNA-binding transcriptional regulator AlpA
MPTVALRRKPLAKQNWDHLTLLDRHQVAAQLGIGDFTFAKLVRTGQFPRPIEVTPNCHRWRVSTVVEWLEEKARAPRYQRAVRGIITRWEERRRIGKRSRPRIRLYG